MSLIYLLFLLQLGEYRNPFFKSYWYLIKYIYKKAKILFYFKVNIKYLGRQNGKYICKNINLKWIQVVFVYQICDFRISKIN